MPSDIFYAFRIVGRLLMFNSSTLPNPLKRHRATKYTGILTFYTEWDDVYIDISLFHPGPTTTTYLTLYITIADCETRSILLLS